MSLSDPDSLGIFTHSDYAVRKRGGRNIVAGALRTLLGVPQEFFLRARRKKSKNDIGIRNVSATRTFTHLLCPLEDNRSVSEQGAAEDLGEESATTLFSFIVDFFFFTIKDNFEQCQLCPRNKNCPSPIPSRRPVL